MRAWRMPPCSLWEIMCRVVRDREQDRAVARLGRGAARAPGAPPRGRRSAAAPAGTGSRREREPRVRDPDGRVRDPRGERARKAPCLERSAREGGERRGRPAVPSPRSLPSRRIRGVEPCQGDARNTSKSLTFNLGAEQRGGARRTPGAPRPELGRIPREPSGFPHAVTGFSHPADPLACRSRLAAGGGGRGSSRGGSGRRGRASRTTMVAVRKPAGKRAGAPGGRARARASSTIGW